MDPDSNKRAKPCKSFKIEVRFEHTCYLLLCVEDIRQMI
jgi:hypothetical protein